MVRTLIERGGPAAMIFEMLAERTLAFVYQIWQHEVALETVIGGKRQVLVHNDRGFTVKSGK